MLKLEGLLELRKLLEKFEFWNLDEYHNHSSLILNLIFFLRTMMKCKL